MCWLMVQLMTGGELRLAGRVAGKNRLVVLLTLPIRTAWRSGEDGDDALRERSWLLAVNWKNRGTLIFGLLVLSLCSFLLSAVPVISLRLVME